MKPIWSALLLLAMLAASCSVGHTSTTQLVYGLTLAPSGIDPHLNASSELTIPLTSVYDTLIYQDPQSGAFVPGLAERWTISEDGLLYTFYLRHDVHFHDGTAFDAEAVKINFDRILDPDNHSQKAVFMLGPVAETEVVDKYTFALHLTQPYAPLLDSLAQAYLGMASPAALAEWGTTEYQFHQVGTGPYRFIEYVPNDHLTLERNAEYAWAPSIYESDRAQIESISFRIYEDPATRALALESGEVDVIGEVPPRDAESLASSGKFRIYPVAVPGQPMQFFFNTRNPPTDDVLVRRALVLAVNRPFIVSTVFGPLSPVAQGPLSASTFGFAPQYPWPSANQEEAVALLEQAGWTDSDGNGQRNRYGLPLQLLIVVPTWGSSKDVAQLVAAAWEEVGADVSIEVAPAFGALKEAQAAGEYNAIAINFFGTDPDLLQAFYASNGLYNWTGYSDPQIDDLLTRGAAESLDAQRRLDIYAQITALVREQALLLPIRDYVNLNVANSKVEDLRFSYQGWAPLLFDLKLAP
jgi:peptide/nickel transport system substrate-binding protein